MVALDEFVQNEKAVRGLWNEVVRAFEQYNVPQYAGMAFFEVMPNILTKGASWAIYSPNTIKNLSAGAGNQEKLESIFRYTLISRGEEPSDAALERELKSACDSGYVLDFSDEDINKFAGIFSQFGGLPTVRVRTYQYNEQTGKVTDDGGKDYSMFSAEFFQAMSTKRIANSYVIYNDYAKSYAASAEGKDPTKKGIMKGKGYFALYSLNTRNEVTLADGTRIPGYALNENDYMSIFQVNNIQPVEIGPQSRSVIYRLQ